jgi:hypothetical protein
LTHRDGCSTTRCSNYGAALLEELDALAPCGFHMMDEPPARTAAKVGLFVRTEEGQQQLIDRLWDRKVIGATQRSPFHDLRRAATRPSTR